MAEDTVQQVVSAAISASVNPHPSMVKPRRGRKKREEGGEGKEREHGQKRDGNSDTLHDTVTLSGRTREDDNAAGFGYDNMRRQAAVGKAAKQDKNRGMEEEIKKIDIRI